MIDVLPLKRKDSIQWFYTGIGSRDIPFEVEFLMKRCGFMLAWLGYTLRSGGAKGSDKAFEHGCDQATKANCLMDAKRIWKAKHSTPEAEALAGKYHGAWHLCDERARNLHGRNVFQVLGRSLSKPSEFVICYTHDKCIEHSTRSIKTGGTGTAISIASENDIPIFNLNIAKHKTIIEKWLHNLKQRYPELW